MIGELAAVEGIVVGSEPETFFRHSVTVRRAQSAKQRCDMQSVTRTVSELPARLAAISSCSG
jgi:hypothetical protein